MKNVEYRLLKNSIYIYNVINTEIHQTRFLYTFEPLQNIKQYKTQNLKNSSSKNKQKRYLRKNVPVFGWNMTLIVSGL